jgi:NifU-like protein
MERPDYIGSSGSLGSGPSITFFLRADRGRIAEARFEAFGCGVTIASGSMLTELVVGHRFADCAKITTDELAAALGGVPPDKSYCPALAVAALRAALEACHSALHDATASSEGSHKGEP